MKVLSCDTGNNPEHLLVRARTGDKEALGQLLGMYRSYLRLLARSHLDENLQRKFDASDVVQDALLQAHRDFHAFTGTSERELTRWLRRILGTRLGKLVRHYAGTKRRDIGREEYLDGDLDNSRQALEGIAIQDQSTPSQIASRREQSVLVADAIEAMPTDYRDVIVLRHIQGLAFRQIARYKATTILR